MGVNYKITFYENDNHIGEVEQKSHLSLYGLIISFIDGSSSFPTHCNVMMNDFEVGDFRIEGSHTDPIIVLERYK